MTSEAQYHKKTTKIFFVQGKIFPKKVCTNRSIRDTIYMFLK